MVFSDAVGMVCFMNVLMVAVARLVIKFNMVVKFVMLTLLSLVSIR